jgi:Protein of unknown function (DUF2398)
VPDDAFRYPNELGDVPYPGSGIVPYAALLLSDVVSANGAVTGGPGPGWRGLPRQQVLSEITDLAERQGTGRGGWPAERVADPGRLLDDVERLLLGVGLLRIIDGGWWLSPVAGRWEAPPNAAFRAPPSAADEIQDRPQKTQDRAPRAPGRIAKTREPQEILEIPEAGYIAEAQGALFPQFSAFPSSASQEES